jgi:uncharacterized protein (TIGR02598 family)
MYGSLRRSRRNIAFSLVEVVLALGIFSFVIVVILALIPISIRSSKGASDDMALSLMIQATTASLHKAGLPTLAALTPNGTTNYYFDANGRMLSSAAGALYGCTAKPISPANFYVAPQYSTNSTYVQLLKSTNFIYVWLQFSWPLSAPTAAQQKTVMVTTIGNYD